jgi:prepilin-type N-terminal cleavage/methylation domain-containing protein
MKKSFTLIELILAIIIISILILAMNNIIINLKSTKDFLNKILQKNNSKELLIKTLYYDILNATSIKVIPSIDSDYDRVYLQTQNSLYHLIFPYVIWYVSKNKNTLIRIESPFKIKLPDENAFFLDKFQQNVKIFKIIRKNGKNLVFIEAKKPIYFEMIDKDFGFNKKIKINKNNLNNKSKNHSKFSNHNIDEPNNLPTF